MTALQCAGDRRGNDKAIKFSAAYALMVPLKTHPPAQRTIHT
jgi:hypothetical protein